MTVKELIDKLQQFNGDRVVLVEDTEYGEFQAIDAKPEDDIGYEVTYPDGYKSWSPAKEFEKAYYKLEDPAGDILRKDDIKRFISNIENVKVGTKTTNTTLTCLTGFEVHGQAACVKPENFDLNVGANYAQIKAEDKIWEGLGFVLQWAKYGLKK